MGTVSAPRRQPIPLAAAATRDSRAETDSGGETSGARTAGMEQVSLQVLEAARAAWRYQREAVGEAYIAVSPCTHADRGFRTNGRLRVSDQLSVRSAD